MNTSPENIDVLADRIAEASALIDSATHQLLADIRRFNEAGGWHRQGALSCAHWLNWRCGIDLGAAREKVRVAMALGALPLVDEALRKGQISYSKVRAMTRVATPDNEATLLEQARCATASQLERICRFVRGLQPKAQKPEERDESRWVRVRQMEDGMVRFEAQLSPDEAALLMKACEPSLETPRRADALVALADRVLRGDAEVHPPVEVLFHVDSQTLAGSTEGGLPVSAETSRRLLCDAGVVPVLEDGEGKPLDVGRKSRTVPPALRRALRARDGGCRFPGCTHLRADGHHLVHWSQGGLTSLSNTLLLCRRHHTLLHEGGYSIQRGERGANGDLTFLDSTGKALPAAGSPPSLAKVGVGPLAERARAAGVAIGPETALPPWSITPPDWDLAVAAVLSARGRRLENEPVGSSPPPAVVTAAQVSAC